MKEPEEARPRIPVARLLALIFAAGVIVAGIITANALLAPRPSQTETDDKTLPDNDGRPRTGEVDPVAELADKAVEGTLPEHSFNGQPVTSAPIDILPGAKAKIVFLETWAAKTPVELYMDHPRIHPLGTLVTDEQGSLRTTITLPEDGAGVHTLTLDGVGAYGVGIGWEVLVRYPGRPLGGDDYATYLCCFEPTNDETTETEYVLITYGGLELGELTPDEDGGVFVPVPGVPNPLTDPGYTTTIEARSLKTGKIITETVRPIGNPNIPGF